MSKKVMQAVVVSSQNDFVSYELVEVEKYFSEYGERFLTHSFAMDILRKIMGRTLTIVDASVSDKQQNKAMKDLIRAVISDEMEFAAEWAFDQKKIQSAAELATKGIEVKDIGTVTIEEALGVQ